MAEDTKKFSFDKFVKNFQERDKRKINRQKEYVEAHKDSPTREYNRLYRELWQNRVRWTKK
jgi:hypothetical protein